MNAPMTRAEHTQFGGTLLGFIVGLVVGLAIAVAVAVYITNAPLPFVTKVHRPQTTVIPSPNGKLPDPNKPLYAPGKAEGAPAAEQKATPPADKAAAKTAGTKPETKVAETAAAKPAEKTGEKTAAADPGADKLAAAKSSAAEDSTRFLLQAGAFKSPEDADAMRARLAMMGLDARIFPIEQSGQTLYRVRLGPYGGLDDINKTRKLLAENGIEAQVVRLK